ncbi:MAG: FecR domain-containing protein [Gammaproteobacteria bacterium]
MRVIFLRCYAVTCVFLLFSRLAVSGESSCSPVKGQLTSFEGAVEIGYGGKNWQPGQLDAPLCEDDSIRVGPNSRAAIVLTGDVILRLDQNTTVRLVELTEKSGQRSVIDLIIGVLHSFSRSPRKLAVNTPFINGMIEGTEFLTHVASDHADITVFEGKVVAINDLGRLSLGRGKSAEARLDQAPQAKVLVRPRDAVQWALYYPPVIDFHFDESMSVPAWRDAVGQSIEFYQAGNFQKAFELIAQIPETVTDPYFLNYRAALFLAVGRVEKASADIQRLLQTRPDDGNALAQQVLIKVVQNRQRQALALANEAVNTVPDSAAVLMALSYAQQSVFNLQGARSTVEQSVKLQPNNALAWARLAELHASFGDLDKALEAAKKAETLNPNLSRTQTVLGFAQLLRVDTVKAKEAFNKAIAFAPSDPLPKLGLGLAKIREGRLAEGRRDLETAVGLDPNNALVRSYLGKAYYEEKRPSLTGREYETAKELDPNDPTPYFYGALQKQTTNRPVEALQDMEKAIELNNNRAVYRSSLALDADLAARSAGMARVYSELGYQELALREGWKSLATDPSNFSAHRFLADSYAVLPRHEIARVSELLQSQLLQPLNMTPIQPRLAESNLFLISAGGPAALSFNEFNPLFNRDGLTFQSNGLIGENDTYAGEGVVSGIFEKIAFSVGGFHSTSDGFRENDDHRDDIGNAFVQWEISPNSSIQAEYRYRDFAKGDQRRRFFADNFSPNERNNEQWHTFRLGGRHSFSESSTLIGNFIYQDSDFGQDNDESIHEPFLEALLGIDSIGAQTLRSQRPAASVGFELEHLFRSEYVNLVIGVGHVEHDNSIDTNIKGVLNQPVADLFAIDPVLFDTTDSVSADLSHTNAYAYSYISPIKNLTFTLGVSGDRVDGDTRDVEDINQVNPKFGFSWEPIKGTTLRFAAFRSLKRTLITNQTLEPTQVAGFNQFYDDFNGTRSWRYGAALDQKFSRTVFGGIELSRRDLQAAHFNVSRRFDWKENMARSYLFWTPNSWLALRAEYQFERLKRDEEFTDGVKNMDAHRLPLGINVFHPLGVDGSGISASLTATYINQKGVYERLFGGFQAGRDDFWILDTALSYRLPKRYGFITVGASNLLDEAFNYFDTDFNNPSMHAGRLLFGKITLALP